MLAWIFAFALTGLLLTVLTMLHRINALRGQIGELKAECARLRAQQFDQGEDLQGLSAAGLQQDLRIMGHDAQLRELIEVLDTLRSENSVNQPYHAAIERARRGAGAEELVAEFGLSLSEADLLARLHGGAAHSGP
ncbi:DUF2802 domain-containing protein [Methylococcus sp. EFPC2]|uniref:DUF2802 domain-containing protein n=1 Tax=Methylococcus sp. EFPC2 TaxID=2812648 RepID=UPI001967C332|nr:DUF2802 domain-containing protein [Methylococcus sp. EFPC2]QSA98887.1 DUF2802 domain-containing protein [Methylococcus sp. EFPC2]